MSHKLSSKIVFGSITKEKFIELLDTMKARDEKESNVEYDEEGRDEFLDLYDYWEERGIKRMNNKIASNNEYLKE